MSANTFGTNDPYIKRGEVLSVGAVVEVTNKASGGAVGTAAATVDIARMIIVDQTTAAQTLTLPALTDTTQIGKEITILNTGTQSFTMLGATVAADTAIKAVFDGTAFRIVA